MVLQVRRWKLLILHGKKIQFCWMYGKNFRKFEFFMEFFQQCQRLHWKQNVYIRLSVESKVKRKNLVHFDNRIHVLCSSLVALKVKIYHRDLNQNTKALSKQTFLSTSGIMFCFDIWPSQLLAPPWVLPVLPRCAVPCSWSGFGGRVKSCYGPRLSLAVSLFCRQSLSLK